MTNIFTGQRPECLRDWESTVDPELVDFGKKVLEIKAPKATSVCAYKGLGKKSLKKQPGEIKLYPGGCHGSVSSIPEDTRTVMITDNGMCRPRHKEKAAHCEPFLKWFINDSPYSFFILNRDDYESCKYGFVLDGNIPRELFHNACITSRHFNECSDQAFVQFNKLVERGVDGLIAYSICFLSNISVMKGEFKNAVFQTWTGHRVSAPYSPENLVNIITGNTVKEFAGPTFTQEPNIFGSSALWVDDTLNSLPQYGKNNEAFIKALCDFRKEKTKKEGEQKIYRPPNPFKQKSQAEKDVATMRFYQFTTHEAVSFVADWLMEDVTARLQKVKKNG